MTNQDDPAEILTAEQGNRLAEVRGEIACGAGYVESFEEVAKRMCGGAIPAPSGHQRIVAIRRPRPDQSVGPTSGTPTIRAGMCRRRWWVP